MAELRAKQSQARTLHWENGKMETTIVCWGYFGTMINGKENGNCHSIWGFIGIMAKRKLIYIYIYIYSRGFYSGFS